MHAIKVKQGFAVIQSDSSWIKPHHFFLFRNPLITSLKVVGCEDCVQENKLPLWKPEGKAHSRCAILAIFSEKKWPF